MYTGFFLGIQGYTDLYEYLSEYTKNKVFSRDVTAAMLVYQNNRTAAILVYPTNPLGIELYYHANVSFYFSGNTLLNTIQLQ